jgi:hypothetical protein
LKKIIVLFFVSVIILSGCTEKPPQPPVEDAKDMNVNFNILFNQSQFELLNTEYTLESNEEVVFKRLSCLLSKFYFVKSDGSKINLEDQYALINIDKGLTSVTLNNIPQGDYKAMGFTLGLDSAINHGDPNQYANDHPLSPFNNSLHWSWAGGYILMALEGNVVNTTDNFIFHIAGSNNRTDFEFPVQFTQGADILNAQIDLNLDEVFKDPEIFSLTNDGMSAHSTTDAVTQKLVGNMGDIFSLTNISE